MNTTRILFISLSLPLSLSLCTYLILKQLLKGIILFFKLNNFKDLYTMFRQAFLLSQYSFICVQYFTYSDT